MKSYEGLNQDRVFQSVLDEALKTAEVREAIEKRTEPKERVEEGLRTYITEQKEEVLRTVSKYQGRLQNLEQQLDSWELKLGDRRPKAHLYIVSSLACFGMIAGGAGFFLDKWFSTVALREWELSVGAGVTLLGVVGLVGVLWRWRRKRSSFREEQERAGIGRIELDRRRARQAFREELLKEGVLPALREKLSDLARATNSTSLPAVDRGGLDSLHEQQAQIKTPAHDELERLMLEMRAGTIGVSGSRGAGKTSLLRHFCPRDQPEASPAQKQLRVFVSAPIEYAPRDFILHLFSEVCYEWCYLFGVPRSETRNALSQPRSKRSAKAPGWSLLLAFLALGLVTYPTVDRFRQMLTTESGAEKGAAAPVQDDAGELRNDDGSDVSGSGSPAGLWRVQPNDLAMIISALAGLFILSILLARPSSRLLEEMLSRRRDESREKRLTRYTLPRSRLNNEAESSAPESWADLDDRALQQLRNIHFQQSFSSGWKGALSVPMVEASHTVDESIAAKQQSLPQIVQEFRGFVERVAEVLGRGRVVIAIDELDKIDSSESAERFLNDIKAIFGIRHCVYLVSVSEQAMGRFQRRGLPYRDAFDSSFDEIVHAEYFDFEHSVRLLNRRVVALPCLFQGLCHILAGGLARDVIRACRTLVTLRDQEAAHSNAQQVNFGPLRDAMILSELVEKEKAIRVQVSVSASRLVEDLVQGMSEVRRRFSRRPAAALLYKAANEVTQLALDVGGRLKQSEANGVDRFERELVREMAVYLYYLGAVREMMTPSAPSVYFDKGGVVDKLAEIRQHLAVSPLLAWREISDLREALGSQSARSA